MKIDLDALHTLDAIATHGSFAKAADALFRVPSAVTYTVRKLEEQLGVELFDRSGHRAVLTPVGQTLLTQGRALLQQADALERRIRQAGQGWEPRLVIAIDEIIPLEALYPVIQQFDLLRTGTQIELTREVFGGTWDALVDRRADLGAAIAKHSAAREAGDGAQPPTPQSSSLPSTCEEDESHGALSLLWSKD